MPTGIFSLEGKSALVVGVANKFSLAWGIAQALHEAGASLILTYQGERVKESVQKLASSLGEIPTFPLDISNESEVDVVFNYLKRNGLDILVHSIAYAPTEALTGRFVDTTEEAFRTSHTISVHSLISLSRRATPLMAARGGGSIITLTYLGGEKVVPHYNVMGVAKAALEHTVRYLAFDLGLFQIRVNAISSGPVSTASSRAIAGFRQMEKQAKSVSPLRRGNTSLDLGHAAVFLCSDAASCITGEVLHVDCGYHILGMTPEE